MKDTLNMDTGVGETDLLKLGQALGIPYSEVTNNYRSLINIQDPYIDNFILMKKV